MRCIIASIIFLLLCAHVSAAAPGPGFFTERPPAQQGLVGQYRGDGRVATSSGVTAWNSETGKPYAFVYTGTYGPYTKPSLTANCQNGRSCVRFNGSTDTLFVTPTQLSDLGASAGEIIVVAKNKTTPGVSVDFPAYFGNSGSVDVFPFSDGHCYDDTLSTSRPDLGACAGVAAGTAFTYDVSADGAGLAAYINGSSQYTAGSNTFASSGGLSTNWLGGYFGSYFAQYDIYEILIYSRKLTSGERTADQAYEKARWATPRRMHFSRQRMPHHVPLHRKAA